MDFAPDARTDELVGRLRGFLDEVVLPAEPVYEEQAAELAAQGRPWDQPAVMRELTAEARRRGLWNLFLPEPEPPHGHGAGLTQVQYAPLAELTGWSPMLAPEAVNCNAPDTGNMELLHEWGTPEQQQRWLRPLLDGEIRSAFCMTEPEVASSDATNIRTEIRRDGDDYVITGRKWWSTGAMSPRCAVFVVMGKTDPHAERHRQQSMVLVPRETPGVEVRRGLRTFGFDDGPHGGHAEVVFHEVRVPATHLIGEEGQGFAIAQARLGPGRIHHCMRLIGMAERALDLMCRRVQTREAFGTALSRQGVVQERIANARVAIEQARLLVLKTAWLMDTVGNRGAHTEIQAIKIAVPLMAQQVIDDAIQAFGGAGVCQDTPLPMLWVQARTLRLADGPDEVHRASLARAELKRHPV
ncbi:MAG: acyl-CoA dehydrogenase family protein [Actinomycetes bacterium]